MIFIQKINNKLGRKIAQSNFVRERLTPQIYKYSTTDTDWTDSNTCETTDHPSNYVNFEI